MSPEILEAVQKSLPARQMDALKAELAKAATVPGLNAQILQAQNRLDAEQKAHAETRTKLSEVDARAKKTEELEKKERDLKVQMLELELRLEREKYQAIDRLVYAAFRNPTISKSYTAPVVVPGSATCAGFQTTGSGHETTTAD